MIVTLALPDPLPSLPHHGEALHIGCTTWERLDTPDRYRLACSDSAAKASGQLVNVTDVTFQL